MTTNKPEVLGFFSEHKQADGGFRLSTDHFETRPDAVRFAFIDVRAVPVIRLSDYEALQAECEKLVEALESLIKGYVGLLEAGMDRITSLGGDCDPVPVMEQNDPWLRDARAVLSSHRKQGDQP